MIRRLGVQPHPPRPLFPGSPQSRRQQGAAHSAPDKGRQQAEHRDFHLALIPPRQFKVPGRGSLHVADPRLQPRTLSVGLPVIVRPGQAVRPLPGRADRLVEETIHSAIRYLRPFNLKTHDRPRRRPQLRRIGHFQVVNGQNGLPTQFD